MFVPPPSMRGNLLGGGGRADVGDFYYISLCFFSSKVRAGGAAGLVAEGEKKKTFTPAVSHHVCGTVTEA